MDAVPPQEEPITIRFGGGLHTRASETDIDDRECQSGYNFDLDLQNMDFKPRKPFDLIGTLPNGQSVNGMACLLKTDGTSSILVQGGTVVYHWDGGTGFTSVGTVASGTKLRGRLEHNWQLNPNVVIITDIALQDTVKYWDGTTFGDISFLNQGGGAFGTFKSKYCFVANNVAWYANVVSSTATPNLIVGSKNGDYTTISIVNTPSSAIGTGDPFYISQPDNRAINGMVQAFGTVVTSSLMGNFFQLTGTNAQDFAFSSLFPLSGASGDESISFVGNDILWGRVGRITSLMATNTYAHVEQDDISLPIFDQISSYTDWTLCYNSRTMRVHCIPSSQSQMWVYHMPLEESGLSPWMLWTTQHPMSMQPTCMMNMIDPVDGLEYVFMGDSSGNFYRLEGTGASGDGGAYSIQSSRTSKLYRIPGNLQLNDLDGYVAYRKGDAISLNLTVQFGGKEINSYTSTISIPAVTAAFFGGGSYYGGGAYYGSTSKRISRQDVGQVGYGEEFQVTAAVDSNSTFAINEVGFRCEASYT